MDKSTMGLWILTVLFGLGAFFSFYMAFLANRAEDSGVFFFGSFGSLFGLLFFITLIKAASKKSAFLKRVDEQISGKAEPNRFVPHRFMMWVIIIAGICILAAIVIPRLSG